MQINRKPDYPENRSTQLGAYILAIILSIPPISILFSSFSEGRISTTFESIIVLGLIFTLTYTLIKEAPLYDEPFMSRLYKDVQSLLEIDAKLKETIIGFLLNERRKRIFILILSLLASSAVYLLASYLRKRSVEVSVVLLLVFLLLAGILNQYLSEYRLRKGYYGMNESEAREIIRMILEYKNKSDFSGGNGQRKAFPEPERDKQRIGNLIPSPMNE
jgi:hypothetical protein